MNGQMTVVTADRRHQTANFELLDILRPEQACVHRGRKVSEYLLTGLPFLMAGILTVITSLVLPFGAGLGVAAAGYFVASAISAVAVYKKLPERKIALSAVPGRYLLMPEHLPCSVRTFCPPVRKSSLALPKTSAPVQTPLPATSAAPGALMRDSSAKVQSRPVTARFPPIESHLLPPIAELSVGTSKMPFQHLSDKVNIQPAVDCSTKTPAIVDSVVPAAMLVAHSDCLAPMALCPPAKPVSAATALLPLQSRVTKAQMLPYPLPESIKTVTGNPPPRLPEMAINGLKYQPGGVVNPSPASIDPISAVPHLANPVATLSKRAGQASAPAVTALAVPAAHSVIGKAATGRNELRHSLLVNVALERSGDDIHLAFGRQALRAASSQILRIEELVTAGSAAGSHHLRLTLSGADAKTSAQLTVTLSSRQLSALAGQFEYGDGRLIIDGKSWPALAGNKRLPLCTSRQSVANIGADMVKPLSSTTVNTSNVVKTCVGEFSLTNAPTSGKRLSISANIPARSGGLRGNPSANESRGSTVAVRFANMPTLSPLLVSEENICSSTESTPPTSPTSSISPSSVDSEPTFTVSESSNTIELIAPEPPTLASAFSGSHCRSLQLAHNLAQHGKCSFGQTGYLGFKRFASEPDIPKISRQVAVKQSLLVTPWLPNAHAVSFGSMSSLPVLSDSEWELLEPFGLHLKRENRDLELHEHLVHQLAYNLEGKDRVILPGKQQCLVEKVTGVPAGLNAYFLIPEIMPANGVIDIRLVFRGTKDRASLIRDLESSGAGFETMEHAAATIIRQLHVILASLNDCSRKVNLTIGGHSLGGADAQNFLGHLLGVMASESDSHLSAIEHITLFTKCSAGVPGLAHERVCSALPELGVRLKIFHLKVAGDVVQATGDCHIGAGLPFETADVSVLQVYPDDRASRIDRHTKKYFTDDTNLSPVYWYKRAQNKTEAGMAEISRSLHNTSEVLRYKVVKSVQWAFHYAIWYFVPSGTSRAKPQRPTDSVSSSLEACSPEEIKVAYDKIISKCLGLSNRSFETPWEKINPYESSAADSVVKLKPRYLEKMLQKGAFSAGAEFQNFVNQVNTHVQNILDPKMMTGLLVMIGQGGELSKDPNLQFKGQVVRDALWPVTAHHCENFFDAAARQYAATLSQSQHKKRPLPTFDLLLQLQAFNIRYSQLERGVDKINYLNGECAIFRAERLALLQQWAASLQQDVGELYRQCKTNRLSAETTAFILGSPLSCINSQLISQKVAKIKNAIDEALAQAVGQ